MTSVEEKIVNLYLKWFGQVSKKPMDVTITRLEFKSKLLPKRFGL